MEKDEKVEVLTEEESSSGLDEISEVEALDPEVVSDDQMDLIPGLPVPGIKPVPEAKTSKKTSVARLDPLTAYLNELKQYSELSRKEEHRLAVKFRKDGDTNAAYALVTSNLTLVVKIAMTFKREWENMLDLIQSSY